MKTPANWFAHPLTLRDACVILKEAVEEREHFYNIIPESGFYPLLIPDVPLYGTFFRTSTHAYAANIRNLNGFFTNIRYHIRELLTRSFDPRNFGQWSEPEPLASWQDHEAFLTAMGIDTDAYYLRSLPRNLSDGKFFYAAADILNNCTLYPALPFRRQTEHKYGCNFGEDAEISITDMVSGDTVSRRYQPDGDVSITLSDGVSMTAYPRYAGYYYRRLGRDGNIIRSFRRRSNDWRVFCQASAALPGYPGSTLQMRGEFAAELDFKAVFRQWDPGSSGFTTATETFSREFAVCPDGISGGMDFSPWQPQIEAAAKIGDNIPDDLLEYETYAVFDVVSARIRLEPENYPELPYKYKN